MSESGVSGQIPLQAFPLSDLIFCVAPLFAGTENTRLRFGRRPTLGCSDLSKFWKLPKIERGLPLFGFGFMLLANLDINNSVDGFNLTLV